MVGTEFFHSSLDIIEYKEKLNKLWIKQTNIKSRKRCNIITDSTDKMLTKIELMIKNNILSTQLTISRQLLSPIEFYYGVV